MSARAIIAPLSFGDTSLPRINLTYLRPIPGAAYDWAANQMTEGPLAKWPSLVDGTPLLAIGTSPTVKADSKGQFVSFDGVSSLMNARLPVVGAQTIVAVYRLTAPKGADAIHSGLSNWNAGLLGLSTDLKTMRALASSGSNLTPSPAMIPDTSWHVSILTVDGPNSALRVDAVEAAGNLTAGTRDGIALGWSGATGNRTAIEYKRVAIIPGSMTADQRSVIAAQMRGEYPV